MSENQIYNIFVSGYNALIENIDGSLYILGDNRYNKCCLHESSYFENATKLIVTLQKDEHVTSFHSAKTLISFHTSSGNLYATTGKIIDNDDISELEQNNLQDWFSEGNNSDESSDASSVSDLFHKTETGTKCKNISFVNSRPSINCTCSYNDSNNIANYPKNDNINDSENEDTDYSDNDYNMNYFSNSDSEKIEDTMNSSGSDIINDENKEELKKMENISKKTVTLKSEDATILTKHNILSSVEDMSTYFDYNDKAIKYVSYQQGCEYDIDTIFTGISIAKNNSVHRASLIALGYKSNNISLQLISSGVTNVSYCGNIILFDKDGNLNCYNRYGDPNETIYSNFAFSFICNKNFKNIVTYTILFPFENVQYVFAENFVYFKEGNYHHMISEAYLSKSKCVISWQYFKTENQNELNINVSDITYSSLDNTYYIHSNDHLYRLVHHDKKLHKLTKNPNSFKLLKKMNIVEPIIIEKNNLIVDDKKYLSISNKKNKIVAKNIVDFTMNDFNIIIMLVDEPGDTLTIKIVGTTISINVHELKHYRLYKENSHFFDKYDLKMLFVYFYENDLHVVTFTNEQLLDKSKIVKKIKTEKYEITDYIIGSFENVSDVRFFENYIFFKCENNYFFHNMLLDTKSAVELKLVDLAANSCIVNKQIVVYENVDNIEYQKELYIEIDSNWLDSYINAIDGLTCGNFVNLGLKKKFKEYSFGTGTTNHIFDTIVHDFAQRYLTNENGYPELKLEAFTGLSNYYIKKMGFFLNTAIKSLGSCLPIRLPVVVVAAIFGSPPKIEELRYIVENINPDIKSKLENMDDASSKSVFETKEEYEDFIKNACGYYNKDETTNCEIKRISSLIAKGFNKYLPIRNIESFNFVTLDYYCSGEYRLDRQLVLTYMCKDIPYIINSYENEGKRLRNILESMSDSELKILLKNWTGKSTITKNKRLKMCIMDDIDTNLILRYVTCENDLEINRDIFKFSNDTIKSLLATPDDCIKD